MAAGVVNEPLFMLLSPAVVLGLLMTRQNELDRAVIANAFGLDFLVLDELHTYRGRQGAGSERLGRAFQFWEKYLLSLHDPCLNLLARQRSPEVGERPARLKDDGLILVHVVHQEDAVAKSGQKPPKFGH
jgi:hypothetical protein